MFVFLSLKHHGWCKQAVTQPKSFSAVFWRCIHLGLTTKTLTSAYDWMFIVQEQTTTEQWTTASSSPVQSDSSGDGVTGMIKRYQ